MMDSKKEHGMASERVSVTMAKERAERLRELVAKHEYESVSAAVDVAVGALLVEEEAKEAWWAETVRRCREAEEHPERLLDAETFHKRLWEEIDKRKRRGGASR